jgi:hypothetical protein
VPRGPKGEKRPAASKAFSSSSPAAPPRAFSRVARQTLGARQLAFSCDPVVLLECVANLILRFAVCGRQSFDDLIQPRYEIE